MSPSIGLFSRRKNSTDKPLRAALTSHGTSTPPTAVLDHINNRHRHPLPPTPPVPAWNNKPHPQQLVRSKTIVAPSVQMGGRGRRARSFDRERAEGGGGGAGGGGEGMEGVGRGGYRRVEFPISPPLSPESPLGGFSSDGHVADQRQQRQQQQPIPDTTHFLRREHELLAIVTGKEKELELLRSSNTLFRRQLAEKESEVDRARHNLLLLDHHAEADLKRKLLDEVRRREKVEKRLAEATAKARADLDAVLLAEERKREDARAAAWRDSERALAHEAGKHDDVRRKAKENMDHLLAEEEKRRAELTWRFSEKIEALQRERRAQVDDLQRAAETLTAEKQQLEQRLQSTAQESSHATQAAQTQKEANEELVEMVTKLTKRLAEEKKRNRRLESKIDQITVDALNNVSHAKRQYQDLKNQFEDRESRVEDLLSELVAVKREKDAMSDAWTDLEAQLEASHQSALAERDERVRNLEAETSLTRAQLEECQRNLEEACIARTPSPPPPTPVDRERELLSVRTDLELYRQDIKAYKHDVKKRDAQIREQSRTIALLQQQQQHQQQQLQSPSSSASSTTPPLDISSDGTDEVFRLKKKLKHADAAHESLRRKHNTFVAQQSFVIADLDKTIVRLRREKAERSLVPPLVIPKGKKEEEGEVIEW